MQGTALDRTRLVEAGELRGGRPAARSAIARMRDTCQAGALEIATQNPALRDEIVHVTQYFSINVVKSRARQQRRSMLSAFGCRRLASTAPCMLMR
ncbi:hypothetical protein AB0C34_23470 [Nocardia sp. NPDC049220]|uniref:hypothetical protein n=1 Tax=Nocardia sp. NPDC049220 TaxID=3155273 RepID=UPI0034031408